VHEIRCQGIEKPSSSNFILHLEKCSHVPLGKRWAAALGEMVTADNVAVRDGTAEDGSVGGPESQQSFMDAFSAQGLAHPVKTVTSNCFGEHLAIAVIKDDLSYSLGKKSGMRP